MTHKLIAVFVLFSSSVLFAEDTRPCAKKRRQQILQDAGKVSHSSALLGGRGEFYQHLQRLPGQEGKKQLISIHLPKEFRKKEASLTIIMAPFDQRGYKLPMNGPLSLELFKPGKLLKKDSSSSPECHIDNKQNIVVRPAKSPEGWKNVSLTFKEETLPWLTKKLRFTVPRAGRRFHVTYQKWINIGPEQWFPAKFRIESFLTQNGNRAETLQLNWSRIKNTLSKDLYRQTKNLLPRPSETFKPYLLPKESQKPLPKSFLKDVKEELQKPFPPFSNASPPEIMFQ